MGGLQGLVMRGFSLQGLGELSGFWRGSGFSLSGRSRVQESVGSRYRVYTGRRALSCSLV